MNCKDSQTEFLTDLLTTQRIIGIIGSKNSGKTYTLLNMIKFCMLTNVYKMYYLILPNFKSDQHQEMYEFMNNLKKDIKVKIYSSYSPLIVESIMDDQEKLHIIDKKLGRKPTPCFFAIDDATASSTDISSDELFIKFVMESRHLRIYVALVVHCIKKVLSTKIRANIDYIMFYKITNSKLLESFYDEFLSLFPDYEKFKEFKKAYFENILTKKYNGMFVNTIDMSFCANIKDWWLNNYEFDKHFLSNNKAKQIEEKK